MISSVHILGDHSAPLKNPGYNAAQLPLTLEREFKKGLRRANEILKLASAFFAQAELDWTISPMER
ncbi:hypothetical protein HMI48_10555 [Acidithiobacillus ferrooxidans]|uniref:hypothetical protein n=1 Tax=Acidithiobacillus ferrooxidans TaxID=920 RepID=UPI001C0772F8|nr:hypothetical protein [Acidithiobacillus ferrooxidans]MBU2774303.1 hypothetical protein [Acidithiobacillus ferrooxidans]